MSVLDRIKNRQKFAEDPITLDEYLNRCKTDASYYASPYQRLLNAIGEPEIVDTSLDARMSRLYQNRKIKMFKTFKDFYGVTDTIERITNYLKSASLGLEESNQILYLLGPVGGGKSSIAERLKLLMEKHPFYSIEGCPVHESPLNLLDFEEDGDFIQSEYGIPKRALKRPLCPHCIKRLEENGGDPSIFRVVKEYPSRLRQIGISKTEPADESTQDISSLVGKVDVRKLADYAQDDPRCYSFSGGLNKGNRGIMEFVEMFKAPLKTLNPLLTATQEGNYNPTEGFSAIPFDGLILAHSNESEWDSFRNEKKNEAFLDRICLVRVPYVLSIDEEEQIYRKLLDNSELYDKPLAPSTLEMLAKWTVITRLAEHENSDIETKSKVYNGETLRDTDPKAKSLIEYKEAAGIDEGMTGMSTRFAFKILSATFNRDPEEVAANPVHLMSVLGDAIVREKLPDETEKKYLNYIREYLHRPYLKKLEKDLQTAYMESYSDYGQNLFHRYFSYADAWIQDADYRDPDTGEMYDKDILDSELQKTEKAARIANAKDYRHEIVHYVWRYKSNNNGEMPKWNSYEKIREVIESRMFSSTEELLPVISFGKKGTQEEEEKHNGFVERMIANGYTQRQVRLLVDWYMRAKKSS